MTEAPVPDPAKNSAGLGKRHRRVPAAVAAGAAVGVCLYALCPLLWHAAFAGCWTVWPPPPSWLVWTRLLLPCLPFAASGLVAALVAREREWTAGPASAVVAGTAYWLVLLILWVVCHPPDEHALEAVMNRARAPSASELFFVRHSRMLVWGYDAPCTPAWDQVSLMLVGTFLRAALAGPAGTFLGWSASHPGRLAAKARWLYEEFRYGRHGSGA